MENNKLETIRKACISANSSILDLKFGCKLKSGIVTGQEYKSEWKCECVSVAKDWKNSFLMPIREAEEEIIGRDITLEDVLVALETFYTKKWVAVSSGGYFFTQEKSEHAIISGVKWKFGKTLEDQDESTIDFIYNLLKQNK